MDEDQVQTISLWRRLVAGAMAVCTSAAPSWQVWMGAKYAGESMVAASAVYLVAVAPSSVYAMTPEEAAALGNQTGRTEKGNVVPAQTNRTTGTFTLGSKNASVNGQTFSTDELFQAGTAGGAGANTQMQTAGGVYGNMAAMSAESQVQTNNAMASGNNTSWGTAYQTLRGAVTTNPGNIKADLRGDPALSTVQGIANGTDAGNMLGSLDGSCTTANAETSTTKTIHMADIQVCTIYKGPETCYLARALETTTSDVYEVASFQGTIQEVTTLTTTLVTQTGVAASYFGTNDAPINQYFTATAGIPTTLTVFDSTGYYGWWSLFAFGDNGEIKTSGVLTVSPFAAGGTVDPGICTYSAKVVNVPPGGTELPATLLSVPSAGNGYMVSVQVNLARGATIYYAQGAKLVVTADCPITTYTIPAEAPPNCTTSPVCTAAPDPAWVSSGSPLDLASNSVWACKDVGASKSSDPAMVPLYPGEPLGQGIPVCLIAQARNYQCTTPGTTIPTNACDELNARPECIPSGQVCLRENQDPITGVCNATTYQYDCGYDKEVTEVTPKSSTTCVGPIRCMGSSCVEEEPKEVNPDFNQAVLALNMATWAGEDQDCSTGACRIFQGEAYTCKVAMWGVQDCCKTPTGTGFSDYVKLAYFTYKTANREAIRAFLNNNGASSVVQAYEALAGTVSQTISNVTAPITNAMSNAMTELMGSTASSAAGSTGISAAIAAFEKLAIENLSSWVSSTFGPELASSLFSSVSQSALGAASPVAGNAAPLATTFTDTALGQGLQMVGTVFMYYQMFVLAVQIIWKCEAREFELTVKRMMKSCHDLGSFCSKDLLGICYLEKRAYCCFKSPLARIVNEQFALHGGRPWDKAGKTFTCPGISIADFANIDWSAIDLSEWIAILQDAKMLPGSKIDGGTLWSQNNMTTYTNANGTTGSSALDKGNKGYGNANTSDPTANARNGLWGNLP